MSTQRTTTDGKRRICEAVAVYEDGGAVYYQRGWRCTLRAIRRVKSMRAAVKLYLCNGGPNTVPGTLLYSRT